MEKIFCGKCGFENLKEDNFCVACGSKLKNENSYETVEKPKKELNISKVKHTRYDNLRDGLLNLFNNGGILNVKVQNGSLEYQKGNKSDIIFTEILEAEDFNDLFIEKLRLIGFEDAEGSYTMRNVIAYREQTLDQLIFSAKEIFENVFQSPEKENFSFEVFRENEQFQIDNTNSVITIKNKVQPYIGFLFLLSVCVFIMLYNKCCSGSIYNNSFTTSATKDKLSSDEMKDHAFYFSQYFVMEKLKAPSTAKFPLTYEMCKVDINDSTYLIHAYVDAQNGFGAMIRNKYRVKLKFLGREAEKGNNWEMVDSVELYDGN